MIDWPQIVREHGDAVWRTAFRMLNSEADAGDCYQETFLSAYRASEKTTPQDWRHFLIYIATRRALDLLRQRTRLRRRTINSESLDDLEGNSTSGIDSIISSESLDGFRELFAQIPEQQAAALWMWGVEELNYEEIARLLGVKVNHVGVLLNRAKTGLRSLLTQQSPGRRV
ncbi:MAG: sigma-70 family RNA polymerase sigma factor [Planctomycetaceae bacterium]|nr:sigma-70 family RNA polymerase sigma factor [Planctomycetaceae bacterium]